jgi:hypothetical protein
MKTSTWVKISMVLLFPMFLGNLVMGFIALEWLVSDTGPFTNALLTGNFNKIFVMILFSIGALGISTVFTTLIFISKNGKQLDDLDRATLAMWEAERTYRRATETLLEKTYNEKIHEIAEKS